MLCVRDMPSAHVGQKTVVCIGCFDALHLGHQALIETSKRLARQYAAQSVCFTFEPYPHHYFARCHAKPLLPRLQRLRDRFQHLSSFGIDVMFPCRFNASLAALSPEQFVQDILQSRLNAVAVVVGEDFRFGHKRSAGVDELRDIAQSHGIHVEMCQPVLFQGKRISSSRVREHLLAGNFVSVSAMLGRLYSQTGVVRYGDGRGRQIGFPTANVWCPPNCLPLAGVYVVQLILQTGEVYPAVANCGPQPTFGGNKTRLEVHCLNFEGNLYHKRCRVVFLQQLRGVKAFESVDQLVAQIELDRQSALTYFDL